ncbi:hypothetical protein B9Z55_021602 [Caenorhabditis nigoni]|uniref:Sdz-33 F-box domain-containing protein n=1 Tax=Caenorhabditis nigoni TaxID=1611254 RepID=A0A2G5TTM6_9PELO|nr:hypothetical protein B9Z55_021602 [Caenorhabditis nigoni]
MDIGDLIAFSLCSNRTKNLVKSSNRKIKPIYAHVFLNSIRFQITPDQQDNEYMFFKFFDFCTEFDRRTRKEVWTKQGFTKNDWVAHFMCIFKEPVIGNLEICNASLSDLDTVTKFIPKCNRLGIGFLCSNDVAQKAILKFSHFAEEVKFQKNIFDNANDISNFFSLNLKSVVFFDYDNPFDLQLSDLFVLNITDIFARMVNITDKELNRFVKLWMKGNHSFYRPKRIKLVLLREAGISINKEEVMKGIHYEFAEEDDFQYRLRRGDGNELSIRIFSCFVEFKFE